MTTAQAEERVERQARAFELLKPYLIDRWNEAATNAATKAATGATASEAAT